jgi:hypothetical protein
LPIEEFSTSFTSDASRNTMSASIFTTLLTATWQTGAVDYWNAQEAITAQPQ